MKNTTKSKPAIAVKNGKFQAQIVRWGKSGVSTIEPLTDWTDRGTALEVFKANGGVPHPLFA